MTAPRPSRPTAQPSEPPHGADEVQQGLELTEVVVPQTPAGLRPAACWRRTVARLDRAQKGGFAVLGVNLPAGERAVLPRGTLVIAVDRRVVGPALPRGRDRKPTAPEDAHVTIWITGAHGLEQLWTRDYARASSAVGATTLGVLGKLLAEHPPPEGMAPGDAASVALVRQPNEHPGTCRWCRGHVRAQAGHVPLAGANAGGNPRPGQDHATGDVEHWRECPPRQARSGAVCAVCGRTVVGSDAGEHLLRAPGGPVAAAWETRHAPFRNCATSPQRTWEEFLDDQARFRDDETQQQEAARQRLAAHQRQQEAENSVARAEDLLVAEHIGQVTEEHPPARVFSRPLRDGRRFSLYLVPDPADPWHALALALIEGKIATAAHIPVVKRHASPVSGLPHVLAVPLTASATPSPARARPAPRTSPVGITDDEAAAVDRAVRTWKRRHAAALRAAVPGAPTWKIDLLTERPYLGQVMWDSRSATHTVVLAASSRRLNSDGWSFGLHREDGWLYTATVRAALPEEMATSQCPCTDSMTSCPEGQDRH